MRRTRRQPPVSASVSAANAVTVAPLLRMPVQGALATTGFLVVVVALYLAKSALGINVFPGPSPLHALFYHWVR